MSPISRKPPADREAKDKAVTTRLTSRRGTAGDSACLRGTAPKLRRQRPRFRRGISARRPSPDALASSRCRKMGRRPRPTPPSPSFKDDGPPVPLETGSIAAKEEITFGEPTVTRAGPIAFAVQLAAGPSLPGLRQSWGQLRGATRCAGCTGDRAWCLPGATVDPIVCSQVRSRPGRMPTVSAPRWAWGGTAATSRPTSVRRCSYGTLTAGPPGSTCMADASRCARRQFAMRSPIDSVR